MTTRAHTYLLLLWWQSYHTRFQTRNECVGPSHKLLSATRELSSKKDDEGPTRSTHWQGSLFVTTHPSVVSLATDATSDGVATR